MTQWYYYINGVKHISSASELKNLALEGRITPQTVIETPDGKRALAKYIKGLTFSNSIIPPLVDSQFPSNHNQTYSDFQTDYCKCPHCGMEEPIEAKVCSFCGKSLTKEPEVQQLPPSPPLEDKQDKIEIQQPPKQTSAPKPVVLEGSSSTADLKPVSAAGPIILAIFSLYFYWLSLTTLSLVFTLQINPIFSLISYFLPLGTVSLVFALQINTYNIMGNYGEAQRFAKRARSWAGTGLACAIIFGMTFAIFIPSKIKANHEAEQRLINATKQRLNILDPPVIVEEPSIGYSETDETSGSYYW
ncbi:MAG: CD225/dispanin family protein [Planctomycetia bacterium]|nr:CD225/dispanin family protein [Planctomycetia bacterium]